MHKCNDLVQMLVIDYNLHCTWNITSIHIMTSLNICPIYFHCKYSIIFIGVYWTQNITYSYLDLPISLRMI